LINKNKIEIIKIMINEVIKIAPSFYGMSMAPRESWEKYGYALLTIAGSDGEVSEPEMDWLVVEAAEALDIGDETITNWRNFDFASGDLASIFASFNTLSVASFKKLLIYDAIRMSAADGEYSIDEREKVFEAANLLRVNPEDLLSIEALIEMESALDKMRLNIF